MKILVDENMPYARDLFSRLGEVNPLNLLVLPQQGPTMSMKHG